MNQEDLQKMKDWAADYEEQPDEKVWDSVQQKLASDDLHATVDLYKYIAVAATVITLLAVMTLLLPNQSGSDVASNTFEVSELPDTHDPFYSRETIQLLQGVY